MSKPLDLTIYPPVPPNPKPATPLYRTNPLFEVYMDWKRARETEARLGQGKRLTQAELAAEAYRQMARAIAVVGAILIDDKEFAPSDAIDGAPTSIETQRLGVVKRFATTPHYFEAP